MYIQNSLYRGDIERILISDFSKLQNKVVFITGASGLVGSCLADILMYLNEKYQYNIDIWATFSNPKSFENRFPSYKNKKHFHAIIQDIMNPFDIDIAPDFIIHTASNTHPKLYATKPVETIKLNVAGTLNILEFARKNPDCKTLFLSTLEVYGENKSVEAFGEEDIGFVNFMKPRACYPESKRTCETLCHSYIQEYSADVRIARLGYIYGPTVKIDSSKADVQFLNNALNNENIVMKSAGMQRRSYLYVFDTASALLTILLNGANGDTYNVAAKSGNILLRDFASEIAKVANVEIKFEVPTESEKLGYSTVTNSTLNAQRLSALGWSEKFSLSEGIQHTYEIKKELQCLKV